MTVASRTPRARSRWIVVLTWQRRAAALRRWVRVRSAAIASARRREQRFPAFPRGVSRLAAAPTWPTVNSGFFPPVALAVLHQEGVAQGAEDQVTLDRPVAAGLEVVQAQLPLALLEQPLHAPAGE